VKIIEHRNLILLEERDVVIQVLALERVGDDRLVLDAAHVGEPGLLQGEDRPLHLPRRGVGRRKGEVPRDVVFEDSRRAGLERRAHPREIAEPLDVRKDGLRVHLIAATFALAIVAPSLRS